MKKSIFIIFSGLGIFALIFGWYFYSKNPNNKTVISNNGNPLDAENLPLGDGKISSAPQKGFLMPCESRFFGIGAFRDGEWIRPDGTWNAAIKPEVDGDVAWDKYSYEISIVDGKRRLIGNGLPNHHTGIFPIQESDDAYQFDRNPNAVKEKNIAFDLPLMPQIAAAPDCVPMGAIGVMKSGTVIFNALDAQGKDAVAHEIQDKCSGHPEIEGQYHYHNLSKCLEEKPSAKHSELVGYALDGFGIFGRFGENGAELTNADLDECHGHTHEILWDGQKINLYHYHATREYPYTIGCFKGNYVTKTSF
jgi:hypothetical protein